MIQIIQKVIVCLLVMAISCATVLGQPGNPNTPNDIPISGLEILMLIGGALGIGKLISNKAKK